MIDVGLTDLIRQVLEVSTADVNAAREVLLEEQRSADARYAASSALVHPEGSTTPINEAYSRAQDRVADLRAKAIKELPAAFKLLLALQVAEERRAEALKHRDMKWDQAFAKDTLGVDPAVADWFARLHQHGVHPHHLKQQAVETVAIIADLITWKAKDAKFRDADNPWRAILQVYASRRIKKPLTKKSKAARSVPGTPTRDRHISDLGDYMFNEMVSAAWGTEVSAEAAIELAPPALNEIIDCSIYPDDNDEDAQEHDAPHSTLNLSEPTPETAPIVPEDVGHITDEPSHTAPGESASEPASPQDGRGEGDNSDDNPPLTPARAKAMAEVIYEKTPYLLGIFWPKSIKQGNYDPDRLIPALEEWVASADTWSGAESFLAAARVGRAREFIGERRMAGIDRLARNLLNGEERALADAQAAGFAI